MRPAGLLIHDNCYQGWKRFMPAADNGELLAYISTIASETGEAWYTFSLSFLISSLLTDIH
jgi:hypothetical protein